MSLFACWFRTVESTITDSCFRTSFWLCEPPRRAVEDGTGVDLPDLYEQRGESLCSGGDDGWDIVNDY